MSDPELPMADSAAGLQNNTALTPSPGGGRNPLAPAGAPDPYLAMIERAACDPAADLRVLDIPMMPETRRRLRREAEEFITTALLVPDHFAAALAIMSDEVVTSIADALCRTVLTTIDP
jgi:hypothetical protein